MASSSIGNKHIWRVHRQTQLRPWPEQGYYAGLSSPVAGLCQRADPSISNVSHPPERLIWGKLGGGVQMSVQMMAAVLLQHFTFEPIHPTGQEIPVDYDITVPPPPPSGRARGACRGCPPSSQE